MIILTELISGAGNTFHIAYKQESLFSSYTNAKEQMRLVATQICKKNSADGFIFLEPSQAESEFKWTFFNNDGSDAEMCGNATRCIGYFLKNLLGHQKNIWNLLTVAGLIKIEAITSNQFKIQMSPIIQHKSNLGFYCDTGVPHLVIETSDSEIFKHLDENLKQQAAELRNHQEFLPKGTNVTYVYLEKEFNRVKAASFERGVEGFTQACGTGAMAAAYYNLTKRSMFETQVEMPGGILNMNLTQLEKPIMVGPAEHLGSFRYEITI